MGVLERGEQAELQAKNIAERVGDRLVEAFHVLALFIIGAAIFWSALSFLLEMIAAGEATLHDILLLFIYLELGAMVGIYFRTDELPVEFLLYITITVMTRKLISAEDLSEMRILVTTGAVLILAVAVLLLRYGAHRFPSVNPARRPVDVDAEITPSGRATPATSGSE
ncbi:phosphate-starvation-inducible PsiE family protein [Wenzhouxiangella sp. XN24]|uniref:phosphate-starvation-inducible protein PsiE n=1 Tax=Wenzhouxiangella sp. XN24 TaxID=2713569 RepID=UPI0013EB3472|nr:phosphate-starvation-inducible PsiE family protein [Wenzhouxiangella sp. XN24]NGX15563.1 phosphate-starvation-inducible protein PsiE [Wenzhouxiangella sp. XN24]